jgi:hypothetical protein
MQQNMPLKAFLSVAYELIDFNISVSTVQFGNTPSNFQKTWLNQAFFTALLQCFNG